MENSEKVRECDYFILSDSVIKRIIPKKFTPRGKTLKQYIAGGAKLCTEFIETKGNLFKPNNVIINIGTRDLQSSGLKNSEFSDLFDSTNKIWPNTKIHVLPIIYRRDMQKAKVDEANKLISSEAAKCENITVFNKFETTIEMYHDHVHLNYRSGLPALVKHLKSEL